MVSFGAGQRTDDLFRSFGPGVLGAPHSVPMWVAVEDGAIAFLCSPGSRKARNLEREDRVVYLIEPEHAWEQAYG
jgi:nitroimidazol reductase NimA-like FMN-containing flavoprotein (pyridoxamine 5'-phosphate oxidase superfamily)